MEKKNTSQGSEGFSDEEKEAMKERSRELRAARRSSSSNKPDGEGALMAKISEMQKPDRIMAERLHAIIKANAPVLWPTTWYGQPAYTKDGKVVCFFQSSQKFKTRYSTLGFSDKANLDEGSMWPTSFALKALDDSEETRIIELIKKAVNSNEE